MIAGASSARAPPEAALAALDRRLDPDGPAPLAVGLSGGSDSLALLLCVLRWAGSRGRPVLALTVDHGLQAESARWTAQAGEVAQSLGAAWRALSWVGTKPAQGLQEVARQARHALLAQAARAAGASVLLLGHTADDVAESALIRHSTPSHGRMAEWSPSPVWPEGRGVFLLRPLLASRRADLRAWLRREGLAWLDDPANSDPRFARTRARAELASRGAWSLAADEVSPRTPGRGAELQAQVGLGGELTFDPIALLGGPRAHDRLAKALLCVSGRSQPLRSAAVQGLLERLSTGAPMVATLGGAGLRSDGASVRLTREPGRTPAPPCELEPDVAKVFDGRFEVTALAAGWRIASLAGRTAGLPKREGERLRQHGADVRPSLPILLGLGGQTRLPAPFGGGPAHARCLVAQRLAAAWGLLPDERALHGGYRGREPVAPHPCSSYLEAC